MPIRFSKMSGSGNDFILIDNRKGVVEDDFVELAKKLCRRALSVGADGLILIESDPQGQCDFAWRFFNADGSEAEMCGNGGRCAARFAHHLGIAGATMSFRTLAGVIHAEITGEKSVKLQLTPPVGFDANVVLPFNEDEIVGSFLDTGVPHFVMQVQDIEAVDVQDTGAAIRYHERFAPAGANANFVQKTGDNALFIRTYERGVEGETLACGTGAVAAALALAHAGSVSSPVQVIPRSGDLLTVHFDKGEPLPEKVFFEGDVLWVYDGVLMSESLT